MTSVISRTAARVATRLAFAVGAVALCSIPAQAQGASRRLELSDTVRAEQRTRAPRQEAARPDTAARSSPSAGAAASSAWHNAFVRDQTLLGALVYAPSFATAVTSNGVAWAASYVVVAGGSFFAASELSRDITITEPLRQLSTGAAVRGALMGAGLGYALHANQAATAGAIFFGSLGGTAGALIAGRNLSEGESAAALFGADAGAATAFGVATIVGGGRDATHDPDRARAATAVAGMLVGFPLGQAYAALAPYRVTAGDVDALWTTAAVGSLAGWATIADSHPSERAVATALTAGGVVGLIAGDRLLVRRYDHSRGEGQALGLGAVAGGLMGAGVGVLTGASHERFSGMTSAFAAAGAVTGIVFTERYLKPRGDERRHLGSLQVDPSGLVAIATRQVGEHSLVRWTF